MRLKHPNIPDVGVEVRPADAEAWQAQGWIPEDPPVRWEGDPGPELESFTTNPKRKPRTPKPTVLPEGESA